MSDLLIILVALGVLIVLGVLVFNWMQERNYRNRIAKDFKPTKRDVLIEDFQINTALINQERNNKAAKAEKQEPTFGNSEAGLDFTETKKTLKHEPLEDKLPISKTLSSTKIPDIDTVQSQKPLIVDDATDKAYDNDLSLMDEYEPTVEIDEIAPQALPSTPKVEELLLPQMVHPQLDLIALLYSATPISNNRLTSFSSAFNEFTEHCYAFGLTAQGEWIEVKNGHQNDSFTKLLYCIQLADRGGPISRASLNRFQHAVETIGLELGAQVEWQGKNDPLNNAVNLDKFCIEVDKTVGFHVLANNGESFHGTKFRGLVESQGLSLSNDGRFVMLAKQSDNIESFYIKNFEGNALSAEMLKNSVMHGCTFQLDIPTVLGSSIVFDNMIAIAKSIAKSLDAEIVDDNRRIIGDIQLEKIRQQLNVINAQMIAKGIIPGSPQALRLFS
jgi:FtsZ-interacting cell division protein ZipA